jgi:YD repeat-containing protein
VATNYGYDSIYQLLSATPSGGTAEAYTYDPVGNRLSSLGVPSYRYNSSNELTSTSTATLGYDNNGNTTSKTDLTGMTILRSGGMLVDYCRAEGFPWPFWCRALYCPVGKNLEAI